VKLGTAKKLNLGFISLPNSVFLKKIMSSVCFIAQPGSIKTRGKQSYAVALLKLPHNLVYENTFRLPC